MGKYISKLKEHRLKNGFTQEELATAVGVRRETIARLEAARYNPSLKLAIDLARVLETSIEKLFIFP